MKYFGILCSLVYSCILYGSSLNGIYKNASGTLYLQIKNDTMLITSPSFAGGRSQVLSTCLIKYETSRFIEINSITHPIGVVFKDISIRKQTNNENLQEIVFVCKNNKTPLRFSVFCGSIIYSSTMMEDTCTISLNKNQINSPNEITFLFEPLNYLPSFPSAQFLGLLYYEYPFKIGVLKGETVYINLPNISEDILNQYFIEGEYVKVITNGLLWRNQLFYRTNN